MVVLIIIIGLFIVLGIIFSSGKGAFLIAGFNTMPQEDKEKYDVVALCKFMGKAMFALSFSMMFWLLSEALDLQWLLTVGLVLFLGVVAFIVIYTNTANRFKKEA